jgi:trehalose 6-phosphate phosphatase
LPDGVRVVDEGRLERLRSAREEMIGRLEKLGEIPGVELEDKKWSIAVHIRQVLQDDRTSFFSLLTDLARSSPMRVLKGPEVFEIQLLPEIDKQFGILTLCGLIRFDPGSGMIVYCGDDENDAIAMKWVIGQGGVAFSVGPQPLVAGARRVDSPESLVLEIRRWARLGRAERRTMNEPL